MKDWLLFSVDVAAFALVFASVRVARAGRRCRCGAIKKPGQRMCDDCFGGAR